MAIQGIRVLHAMPGRVRLRVDKVKGNPEFAKQAQDQLGRVPGVKQVEAKPQTGSVLVYYDAAALLADGTRAALTERFSELFPEREADVLSRGLDSLIGHLAAGGAPEAAGTRPQAVTSILASLAAINDKVGQATGGADLKLLIPMTLLFLGVRSLWTSKKAAVPAWYDFLWFGFSSFVLMNLRDVATQKERLTSQDSKRGSAGASTITSPAAGEEISCR
jgi:copper chaperone CopZ